MQQAANTGSSVAGKVDQYLTFRLGGQEYGVDILSVQEIKGWDKPTRIPHAPPHMLGVINLRGAVVPVVDLRHLFGLEIEAASATTVVIVVRVNTAKGPRTAGLVVDAVCEVCDVTSDNLRAAPEMGDIVGRERVRGLATLGERMVILLVTELLIDDILISVDADVKVA